MKPIVYWPIGLIRSRFKEPRGTPIDPPAPSMPAAAGRRWIRRGRSSLCGGPEAPGRLLDIKPYVPQFDAAQGTVDVHIGWLEDDVHKLSTTTDDGRFTR